MKPLQALKLFVESKDSEEERHEIRAYVLAEASELAPAFGVTEEKLVSTVEGIGDEVKLARGILAQIKAANSNGKKESREAKNLAAQAAADKLGASVTWDEGGRARLDVGLLFASLTRTGEDILFRFPGAPVPDGLPLCIVPDLTLHQRPLLHVRNLHRKDLTAYVDSKGLHFRWPTGGLTFCHQEITFPAIIVNLPEPSVVQAPVPAEAPRLTPRATHGATHGKDPPMSPDTLIDAFQAKCLALLAEVQQVADTELATLTRETESLKERLVTSIDAEAIALAAKEALERDLTERDEELAALRARIDLDPAEQIDALEIQLRDVREELATSEKDLEATQKELHALREAIPEPELLAGAVHDFLRDDSFLPANLDVPLRIAPHAYREGLSAAVALELPS